ncbi:ABC transporter substrate-binding protein [Rhodococcus olei]|uniref:ABC transporter substrate-binding protein n=1 Tax=Rhodococcus olei TaxID=2161675 RepID=A0ABP8NYG1_9NOCA
MSAIRKMRQPIALGVLTTSLVALSAAACGSNGGASTDGVTSSTVKVAVVTPTSGPLAPAFAGFAEAAQARVNLANEGGGVNGRKIEVEVLDDAADGTKQVTAGKTAIESDHAFAVLMASQVDTMLPYMKQKGIPIVGYPSQPAYTTDRNVFGVYGVPPIHYASTAFALGLQNRGVTKLAVFSHNTPGGVALAKSVAAAADKAGVKVVLQQNDVPESSFDATSVAVRMKEVGADGAFLGTSSGAAISILEAAKRQGVGLKTSFASSVRSLLSKEPDVLEGTLSRPQGTVSLGSDVPAAHGYVAAMAKYAPGTDPQKSVVTQVGWLAADLFIKGLEKAGADPTRAGFIDHLRKVTDYDAGGLLVEPITFAEGVEPNGNPLKCIWFEQVKSGAYVADPEPTCGELFEIS